MCMGYRKGELQREKKGTCFAGKRNACHVHIHNFPPLTTRAQWMNNAIYGELLTGNFKQARVCTLDVAKPYDAFVVELFSAEKRESVYSYNLESTTEPPTRKSYPSRIIQ